MPKTAVRVFQEADGSVPLRDWLNDLEARSPRAYRKCLDRILLLEQMGYKLGGPSAKSLRDGISELRIKDGRVNYRILYFFAANAAYLSHGIRKEDVVPPAEIDLAVERMKLVAKNPATYTAEWET
jgi:phage-related protein